jgi:hypothetical protein
VRYVVRSKCSRTCIWPLGLFSPTILMVFVAERAADRLTAQLFGHFLVNVFRPGSHLPCHLRVGRGISCPTRYGEGAGSEGHEFVCRAHVRKGKILL